MNNIENSEGNLQNIGSLDTESHLAPNMVSQTRLKRMSNTGDRNNINMHLPREMIIEILIRLPVESILRSKSVCKKWNSIVQDRDLIDMHFNRRAPRPYQYYANGYESLTANSDETFKFKGSQRGLLLETRDLSPKYRIRNPSIRQSLNLPDPHEQVLFITFAYVEARREYKVVSSYHDDVESCYGWEVITLGSDSSWRTLKTADRGAKSSRHFTKNDKFVYGFRLDDYEIDCLDLETELFTVIEVPRGLFSDWQRVTFLCWAMIPSLGSIDGEGINLWKLKNYKQQKWAYKRIVMPCKSSKKELPYFSGAEGKKKKFHFRIQPTLFTFEGMRSIQSLNSGQLEEQ